MNAVVKTRVFKGNCSYINVSKKNIARTTLYFLVISSLTFPQSPKSVKGIVTDGNNPIQGAIIRWQATTVDVISDNNGKFELEFLSNRPSDLITAWKHGYYNGGTNYESSTENIEIVLDLLPKEEIIT